MLWSTIGLLTAGLLLAQFVTLAAREETGRTRWLGSLMVIWAVNVVFGLSTFVAVYSGVIERFIIWKGMLMASSVIFMGIVGMVLHVVRNVPKHHDDAETAYIVGLAGIACLLLGSLPLLFVLITNVI